MFNVPALYIFETIIYVFNNNQILITSTQETHSAQHKLKNVRKKLVIMLDISVINCYLNKLKTTVKI